MNEQQKPHISSQQGQSKDQADNQANNQAELSREQILSTIGFKLREARAARNEQIEDAVRILKLQRSHLTALESGNWQSLPDEVYALGFLRQYCRHLNLDLNHEIELLKQQQYKLTKPLTFPDPPVAPSRRWAWMAGLAFVLLFIIYNVFDSGGSQPESMTPQSTGMEQSTAPDASTEAEPVELQSPDRSPVPADEATEINSPEPAPAVVDLDAATTQKPAASKPAAAIVTHHYRFEAVGKAVWLQVYLPDANGNKGKKAREALINPGHHIVVTSNSSMLWITCGNAPALRVSVDNKLLTDAGTLGNGRKVLRDHRLDLAP